MIGRKSVILSVSVIAILVSSTMFVSMPAIPRASAQAQLPREQKNWEFINHDGSNANYSPQTQINKDNVKYLELKWLFPWPGAQSRASQLKGYTVLESAITPPLVVDGIVYVAQQDLTLRGFDAKTGKILMQTTVSGDLSADSKRLPIGGSIHTHIHGINTNWGRYG